MTFTVFKYDPETHYDLLKSWFDLRQFPAPNPRFLPPIGAIVFFCEMPVCGGFLFRSDAGAAIIGHLVSNPDEIGRAHV